MYEFVPGTEPSRGFYEDVVNGILKKTYPELVYSAGFTTKPVEVKTTDYYGRPYKVLFTDSISEALVENIEDEALKKYKLDDIALLQTANGIDASNGWKWLRGMV